MLLDFYSLGYLLFITIENQYEGDKNRWDAETEALITSFL